MQQYSWFDIYRVAMLEIDSDKVAEGVAYAREKLQDRLQMAGLNIDEQQAIVDALNNLHALESSEKSRRQIGKGA